MASLRANHADTVARPHVCKCRPKQFRPYWVLNSWTPHRMVNHSRGFKCSETGTHTNYIEGSFGNLKNNLRNG